MKRISLFSSIAALCIAIVAAPAMAQEGGGTMPDWANKNGAFGVGANTTLGGVNGLNIRTYVTPLFGIHATIGLAWRTETQTVSGQDATSDLFSFRAGLYGSYKLAYWQRGHLSVIFGVDIVTLSLSTEVAGTTTDSSGTDILIGLGLMGEWFPTQYLSLFAEVGIRLDFLGNDEVEGGSVVNTDPDVEVSGIQMTLDGDLFGQAGFTVWFQ